MSWGAGVWSVKSGAGGGGGSQTPWTGDVDAAGHSLTGLLGVTATGDPDDGDQFSFQAGHGASFVALNGTLAFASTSGNAQFSAHGGTGFLALGDGTVAVTGDTTITGNLSATNYTTGTTFTATGSWTNTTYSACRYWITGKLMTIHYHLAVTGVPASAAQLSLAMPSGFSVDAAAWGSPYNARAGDGSIVNTGVGTVYPIRLQYLSSVPDTFYAYNLGSTLSNVTKTSPITVDNGVQVDVTVTVPIQ